MRVHPLVAGLTALLLPIALTVGGWAVAASAPTALPGAAPDRTYAVGVRTLDLGRGTARPLPVTVWYPARSAAPAGTGTPTLVPDAQMAPGRFPVVLFSHGLHSLPEMHAPLTTRWAAAGFVVAAPAYPHTRARTPQFDRADIRRQPADAWRALDELGLLNQRTGDRFAGHLALTRIGAAGHSAGGYTTSGLFAPGHSEWLRGGIVLAGGGMPGASYGGPSAPLLFLHGDADRVVPLSRGREAYQRVPWPKAFVTLPGRGHGDFLTPGRPDFDRTVLLTTNFLRWTLYGDPDALATLRTAVREGPFLSPDGTGWSGGASS
ncbi:alpha/beta hydrolase [Plantactinospora sp. B24E8]|uniref:alpha/beta hydrolase family protein n=1 Tax=Plantactinospora sp. B24E8 TaxID=3153567 RepID=UPI00325E8E07